MLHAITRRLEIEICIDINVEISEVDDYTWIFTSRVFRLALEITFWLNKYFFLQMAYELLSQSWTLNKREVLIRATGLENFLKKNEQGGTLMRHPRVLSVVAKWYLRTMKRFSIFFWKICAYLDLSISIQISFWDTFFITGIRLIGYYCF